MRLNYESCIVGSRCVLVPYRPCHVSKYHEWMKQPFLLEMTGSEPLSLKQEVEMLQSWRDDDTKCTFIVLAKDKCLFLEHVSDDADFCQRNVHAMNGDVNLFFSEKKKTKRRKRNRKRRICSATTAATTAPSRARHHDC